MQLKTYSPERTKINISKHRVLKNLNIPELKILKLDRLKLLLLRRISNMTCSKMERYPKREIMTYYRWEGQWGHAPNVHGLYRDEVSHYIIRKFKGLGASLAGIAIQILLYANDIVLISDSPEGLQRHLKAIKVFCWDKGCW